MRLSNRYSSGRQGLAGFPGRAEKADVDTGVGTVAGQEVVNLVPDLLRETQEADDRTYSALCSTNGTNRYI
jgi:hypothetical protein